MFNRHLRVTRVHIQGIVSLVFDIAEKYGVTPQPEDFAHAIKVYIEDNKIIDSFPGIDNKRLPVPEINMSKEAYETIMQVEGTYAYDEPHESGGNVHITMTKRQAIAHMKSIYGHRPKYKDATDEQLFDEWVTVNWAYKENEKEIK